MIYHIITIFFNHNIFLYMCYKFQPKCGLLFGLRDAFLNTKIHVHFLSFPNEHTIKIYPFKDDSNVSGLISRCTVAYVFSPAKNTCNY